MTIEEQVQEQMALDAMTRIATEWKRASKLHPVWPTDVIHAAAILAEEAGETVQAALDLHYKAKTDSELSEAWEHLREEATQTGAMAVRILTAIGSYVIPVVSHAATEGGTDEQSA
jgi:uncharacterized protein YicC (UPF0701 family)